MNAALDLFHLRKKTPFFTSKFALFLTLIPLTLTFAWFFIPFLSTLISSTIPTLSSSLRTPYLFIAVNFIILTIWKLSQNRVFYADRLLEDENPFNTDHIISSQNPHLFPKNSLEDFSKIPLIPAQEDPSLSSCVTTVSEEKSTASSSSSPSESALRDRVLEGREDPTAANERDEVVSLDATWSAISGKSGRWESNDVQKQRFDDFIKKNYDQIRSRKPGIKIGVSSIE